MASASCQVKEYIFISLVKQPRLVEPANLSFVGVDTVLRLIVDMFERGCVKDA